jgi:hypothetical protein
VTCINAGGTVAGQFIDTAGIQHGFVGNGDGTRTIDPEGSIRTDIAAINDGGSVAGSYVGADGSQHGFIMQT